MTNTKVDTRGAAIAKVVARNFTGLGVKVRPVSGTISEYGVTCTLALKRASIAQLTAALRMGPVLEMVHHVGGVRVWAKDGYIIVQIPSPAAPQVVRVGQLPGRPGSVALGMSLEGKPVYSTWERNPHMMLLGPTGCGKTTLTRAILQQLPGHQVAVAAFKAKDWQQVEGATVLTSVKEIEQFGRWVVQELRRRAPLGEDLPLCWVVDDAFNLLSACSLPLDEIASLGRGLGTRLIIASQRAGDAVGGAMAAGNIPGRIVFRTASANDAAQLTGRAGTGAERLKRFHALFVTPDDIVQFKAAVPDGNVTALPVTWDSVSVSRDNQADNRTDNGNEVTDKELKRREQDHQIRELLHRGVNRDEIYRQVFNGRNDYYKRRIDAVEQQMEMA